MSSARSHIALPCLELFLDKAFSWSPASLASRRALSESLIAEAIATSAAATTSATIGLSDSAFSFFAALFATFVGLAAVSFLFLSFFFFLSLDTGFPLGVQSAGLIPFSVTT